MANMRDWLLVAISAFTLAIMVSGGVYFFGQQGKSLQHLEALELKTEAQVEDIQVLTSQMNGDIRALQVLISRSEIELGALREALLPIAQRIARIEGYLATQNGP